MKTWNERLKFARTGAQLRQKDIADEVGVSSATVSDWESGEIKNLEGENLLKVCDMLNISPHWLLLGKGEMTMQALTNDDLHALKINRALGVKERRAWYRAGDSLAEPDEPKIGNNETK
jgi:transcriptional regulator with XRE-family HTH domain